MSGLTTAEMSRILVAGTSDELAPTLDLAARLRSIHFIDHDGEELSLGSPNEAADSISQRLATMRGCLSQLGAPSSTSLPVLKDVRSSLEGSFAESTDSIVEDLKRLDTMRSEIDDLDSRATLLARLAPLGLDFELFEGYDSLSVHLGEVADIEACLGALNHSNKDVLTFTSSGKGKQGILAIFCEKSSSDSVDAVLTEHAFQSIAVPEGHGSMPEQIVGLKDRIKELHSQEKALRADLESWKGEHGAMLVGGIELLESDFEVETAPVRVAVSEHSFILEGWVLTEESEATTSALKKIVTHVECTPFEVPHGGAHHHSDDEVEFPPIALQNIGPATPYELLTDAIGRPKYGNVDPSTFMMITYPLFFGLMLGDIAYGLAIVGLGYWVSKSFGRDEMLSRASRLLYHIGISTIIFGYLFGEFAGWEYLPHYHHGHWEASHAPGWATWLTMLYPNGGEIHWTWTGPFGATLAYPFHRVSSNLEDLIILTMYLGILHLAIGLLIGFRDVYKGHGLPAAIFEKGSWLLILSGGFFFAYAFLTRENHSDEAYVALLDLFMSAGLVVLVTGILLLIVALWKYEEMPLPIAIALGPIESVQALSNTVSYVRLFAVGVVGVKIAETGNKLLYQDLIVADGTHLLLIPIAVVGWLAVHLFALVLGVFSPNVQAARLHFVEWMGKFYETGGEPFKPFGKKLVNVEAD